MAKLRIFKSIENQVYKVRFENDAASLSEGDKELMAKFGEPEINMGGVFLDGTQNEYTLPDNYVRVRSDLPLTVSFDSRDADFTDNTITKVDAFVSDITGRFNTAFTTLRANSDAFTAEVVENI